jgi:hypothetical protein
MLLIQEPGFPLAHDLKLVALQGDCSIKRLTESSGGRYAVEDALRSRQSCMDLIERARAEHAHLALIPEMVIPKDTLEDLIAAIGSNPEPLVVVGGIEGLSPADYRALVIKHGGTPDLPDIVSGTYVNAMIVAVRASSQLRVYFRAKRYASGPENAGGPQVALGNGEFLVLKLGSAPFVIVPLICSELVWPDLLSRLASELDGLAIDLIPVLQRNKDIERRHLSPVIHTAYQRNLQARFVLANQALLQASDGTCFVVTPPASPAAPAFDHGRQELWLPESCTYKGFRIPDRTGCFWYAEVRHCNGPMDATRPPVCAGRVLGDLTNGDTNTVGLSAGLMRSGAANRFAATSDSNWSNTEPKRRYRACLTAGDAHILKDITRVTADDVFFRMTCGTSPSWTSVESLVEEFVEAGALLASGGDQVRLAPCPGGNCKVGGRSVSALFSPVVDVAFEHRFSTKALLEGEPLPVGVVLLKVEASSRIPRAKTVGDVLRADRISTESPELSDGPVRTLDSAVIIGLGNIHFCEVKDLRPSLEEETLEHARNRTTAILPEVFA